MELWQAGLTIPEGMTIEAAVDAIRPALPVKSGAFEVVEAGEWPVIMIELDGAFERLMTRRTHFEAERVGVKIEIDLP